MSEGLEGPVFARLLRLLHLLRTAPAGLTDDQLAGACGVCAATVRADLRLLSEYAGVPLWVEGEPDNADDEDDDWAWAAGHPWHLYDAGYVLPALPLTQAEVWALLEALGRVGDDSVLKVVQLRLREALLGKASREQAAGQIIVKGVRPVYDTEQPEGTLRRLERAVSLRRRLRFCYTSAAGEASERRVDPYGLLYYWVQGAWYLVGYCHQACEVRTFRVERLSRLKELDERFACPADFCLEDYFRYAWGVDRGERQRVAIRFWDHYNVLSRVRKETAHRQDGRLEPELDGTWLYTDVVAGINEIRVWVRSFGESAEVLAPEGLRQGVRESAEQILARYGA